MSKGKLSEVQVQIALDRLSRGQQGVRIARDLGVTPQMVSMIKRDQAHREIRARWLEMNPGRTLP